MRTSKRQHILHTLEECNWVIAGRTGAAAKLGMKRTSLQYKMQKLGIIRLDIKLVPELHGDSSGVRGAAFLCPGNQRPTQQLIAYNIPAR